MYFKITLKVYRIYFAKFCGLKAWNLISVKVTKKINFSLPVLMLGSKLNACEHVFTSNVQTLIPTNISTLSWNIFSDTIMISGTNTDSQC